MAREEMMADTEQDINFHEALAHLEANRELGPCEVFEHESRLLFGWCKCGWSQADHMIES